ncbi:hypothetical protein GCM10009706_14450 [Curtobacterium citreum]|uniref:PLL-like beta propeller domain-containing protein n=1 Tax=Curtobacterium citreum TaxID=2036 RepID=A0ABT2HDK0_9MICO|nr:hypothetical protein [Curtobacterium citreum]MCS6521328.1 hypothetical protein [Curtobacterium citreum]GGL77094.1 hypothetical protein GCM10009706_14450 [Curtobacterium citreum]
MVLSTIVLVSPQQARAAAACGASCENISGDSAALAKQLVAFKNAGQFEASAGGSGNNDLFNNEIVPIANGSPTPTCKVDVRILQTMVILVKQYGFVQVNDLNRECKTMSHPYTCAQNPRSLHCIDPAVAIDFGGIGSRNNVNGSSSQTKSLLTFLDTFLPRGSQAGQVQCRSTWSFSNITRQFDDTCNHQHVDLSGVGTGLTLPAAVAPTQNRANKLFPSGPIGYNSSNDAEVFAISSGGDVVHNYSTPGQGTGWSGFSSLQGSSNTKVTTGKNSAGNAEVFAIGGGGVIFHKWFIPGTGWSDWNSLGKTGFTDMALSYNVDGNEVLYAIGDGGVMWQAWYDSAKGWTGWSSLGGDHWTDVTTGFNRNGEPEIFAIGGGGRVFHKWFTKGVGWNDWSLVNSTGGFTKITLAYNAAGDEELFGIGSGGAISHAWYDSSAGWTAWNQLQGGPSYKGLAVGVNALGFTEVFGLGTDGALYNTWYDSANGWGTLTKFANGPFVDVAVGYNAQDREEVFTIGTDGQAYHKYATPGEGTGWSNVIPLGGTGLRWG